MAFKNLEERFTAKIDKLYNQGSTRDGGSKATQNDQPYLEFKPNDPDRNETAHDTRTLPVGSVKRDLERIGKFSISPKGLLFYAKQELLQLNNEFTENRIINPFFVVANLQPYKHFSRGLASARDFELSGDGKSPISDTVVGSAGRLQRHTGNDAISRLTGSVTMTSMLSLFGASQVSKLLSTVFSVGRSGGYGVNQRPEFDVNGKMYSVLLWNGFVTSESPVTNVTKAAANFRVGDIKGAINNIKSAFKKVTHSGDAPINSDTSNMKYFITDKDNAIRYLKNSVVDDGTTSRATIAFLSHRATDIGVRPDSPQSFSADKASTADTTQNIIQRVKSIIKNIKTTVNDFQNLRSTSTTNRNALLNGSTPAKSDVGVENAVATNHLTFPDSSLQAVYNDDSSNNIADIKQILSDQKDRQVKYWETRKNITGMQYGTNIKPGQDADKSLLATPNGRYLTDGMNIQGVYDGVQADKATSLRTIQAIRDNAGQDLIDVMWFDFVGKKTIPFRAYISSIVESVNPEFNDTRYIGRIERNIVYAGVIRELSMQLHVYAMAESELEPIWNKISYMTGLCFPSMYASGFMVPPLVKLTLGDVYRDQPGYIRSLTHTIEDGTSWEITPGHQRPHGIVMSITFSVIEKQQMFTNKPFYPRRDDPLNIDVNLSDF